MSNYHLIHIESKTTLFNLSRLEMVNKLKHVGDYQNWYCWYPGLAQWKLVSQAYEVKEWMSFPWTEEQPRPEHEHLFSRKSNTSPGDFEVVEFTEAPVFTPPPLPPETEKTEFVISGFSGQVFDFDDSLKDKHFKSNDFKIVKEDSSTEDSELDKTVSSATVSRFDNTVKVETTPNDFDKTVASAKSLDLDKTHVNVSAQSPDFEKTVGSATQLTFDKTIRVDSSGSEFDKTLTSSTILPTEKTLTAIEPHPFDNTTQVNLPTKDIAFEQTAKVKINQEADDTNKIEPRVNDFTITKDLNSSQDKGLSTQASEDLANAAGVMKKHNRRYPRIKGRLRTIITNKSKAFMTFTKDISLGGIYVENMIPHDILNSEIEVYLSDPSGKKSILFRCLPVGDMKNPCRFSFAKADEKNIQKLGQWLDDLAKINVA